METVLVKLFVNFQDWLLASSLLSLCKRDRGTEGQQMNLGETVVGLYHVLL